MPNRRRGIFISYRRDDAAGEAGRLADHLELRFGPRSIFFDIAQIVPGDDWRQQLDSALEACDTMLVVIGRNWLEERKVGGKPRRRVDDPDDMVSWEIAQALRRGMRVIQTRVQGAAPLAAQGLPPAIFSLAMRQAYTLRHESFADDVRLLGDRIVSMRRARGALGADWSESDLATWARRSGWAVQPEGEAPFSGAAVAIVHAMELLLRRADVDVALSAGYLDARSRAFERAPLERRELALSTCIYVASLIGVPLARRWPRKLRPRRRPVDMSWQALDWEAETGGWCRGDFFRVDALADITRHLAAGRPVICLCWFDYREGDSDSPIDDEGVLRHAPALEHRNARGIILIVGYDPASRRFRCMHSIITHKSVQIMFDVPVEVARAAFDVRLIWAVEVGADSIERLRSRRRANATTRSRQSAGKKRVSGS